MDHRIERATRNFQGCFARERAPILTIASGDTVTAQTLDAGWGLDPFAEDVLRNQIPLAQRPDPVHDTGHCLVGPIAVRDAHPVRCCKSMSAGLCPRPSEQPGSARCKNSCPSLGWTATSG
jgi:hypothetical protein